MKAKGIFWIVLTCAFIGLAFGVNNCDDFNKRWKKVTQNKRTWGKQTFSELKGAYVLITVNCSYEPMDESVVRCTANRSNPVHLLSLIRCPLSNFNMGPFLNDITVKRISLTNDGPKLANLSVILHDQTRISNIQIHKLQANGLFSIKVANKTNLIGTISIDNHDLTGIDKENNWDLMPNLTEITIINGQLVNFSPPLPNSLYKLDLKNNRLQTIPSQTLDNLDKLQELSLSNNKLSKLNEVAFNKLSRLDTLDLSRNQLKSLGVMNLKSLTKLDLSNNQLTVISGGTFNMQNLEQLDLAKNQLKSIQEGAFNLKNLKELDLSSNRLTAIGKGVFNLDLLEKLKLSNNSGIVFPEINPFGTSSKLIRVEAMHCTLKQLPNIHGKRDSKLIIDFSNNQMGNITLPLYSDSSKEVIIDGNGIVTIGIRSNFDANKYNIPVSYSLLSNQPVCNCSIWDFLNLIRQPNASSFFKNIDKITCTSGKLAKNAFDGLFCLGRTCPKYCHCGPVINCTNVGLYVAPSSVLLNVTKVHLERNSISTLSNIKQEYWDHVTHLYISHNNLTSLESWNIPKALKLLAIDYNHLESFPSSLMEKVTSVPDFSIFLAGNNWKCDCPVMSFMKSNALQKIADSNTTFCSVRDQYNDSFTEFPVKDIPIDRLCSSSKTGIIVSVTLVIVFIFGISIIVYRFRGTVVALLYSRNLIPSFFLRPSQGDKEYDAVLFYNEADQEKVDKMITLLEPRNRLFVPGRDSAKTGVTASDYNQWIQNSRMVLLLMTNESLQAEEFRQQCRCAFKLKRKGKSRSLISIIGGDLKDVLGLLLEEDIRQIILTQPSMIWEERWFWQKLRLALRQGADAGRWQKVRSAWQRSNAGDNVSEE